LWLILGIALAVRLGAAIGLQWLLDHRWHRTFLIEGDANGYWHLAEDLAAGREFAIYNPPRRVLRMPGFPAVLAAPIRLCESPTFPARMMLAGVGTVGCWGVYVLGRWLFDPDVGLIGAALTALSPACVAFSPVILSETLFAVTLLGSLAGMLWLVRVSGLMAARQDAAGGTVSSLPVRCGVALMAGALVGVACYVRPSWLLASPLVAVGLWCGDGCRVRAMLPAALVTVGTVAVLLPWGLRNQRVTGHFVLTTLWLGPSLYDGLNPQATGDSDMTFYDRENLMARGMSEFDVNRHYTERAWAFVREQPARVVELAAIKLWRFLKPWPNASQFGDWRIGLVIGTFYLVSLVLAARGWWVHRHDVWTWGLPLLPLAYFAALHMVFVGSLRYRLPAEYPLLVLSAAGWQTLRRPRPEQGIVRRALGRG
jgi:hypothetical protein